MAQDCRIERGVPCVYEIYNSRTGKRYIGSTARYRTRFNEHRRSLHGGTHHSVHLQRSFNRHGKEAFVMRPLEIVSCEKSLVEREQFWIDRFGKKSIYNQSLVAGRPARILRRVYRIDPKSGVVVPFADANVAASKTGEACCPQRIREAANTMKQSAGYYWSYFQNETLGTIKSKTHARKQLAKMERPDKVFCFDSEGSLVKAFKTVSDAARFYGVHHSHITSAIGSPRYRTAAGLIWSYSRKPKEVESKKTKAVYQVSNGVVLRKWASCIEAAQAVAGVTFKGISSAATGYTKSHRGYEWVFAKT